MHIQSACEKIINIITKQLAIVMVAALVLTMSASAWSTELAKADHGGNHILSGVVYSDEGITPIGAGKNLTVLIEGVAEATAVTDSAGAYTTNITVSGDEMITVFLDGETEKGVTVETVLDIDIPNVDVYAGHTNIRGRINQIGTVDESFVLADDIDSEGSYVNVVTVAEQTDNKLIIGGNFRNYDGQSNLDGIARFNEDGSRDTSFSPIEHLPFFSPSSIVLQPDGKIIVGGNFDNYAGDPVRDNLIRLNVDGSLDTTFNTPNMSSDVRRVVIQPDGKLLVGGQFQDFDGVTGLSGLARLNADGSRDTTFALDAPFTGAVNKIVIDSNGRIIVAGTTADYDGQANLDNVAVLNPDGSRDTSFIMPVGPNSVVFGLDVQADDKIIISGNFDTFDGVAGLNSVARLNPDGTRDTGFATNTFTQGTSVQSIFISADGKILLGGFFSNYNGIDVLTGFARFNPDGTLDQTFEPKVPINGGVVQFLEDYQNRIIIVGIFNNHGGDPNLDHLARLNTTAGGSITNADLDTANNGDADVTALYADGGGNTFTAASGTEVTVTDKGWYVPGGNIDVGSLTNSGLIDLEANDANVEGDLVSNLEVIATSASTITFDGTDQLIDGDLEIGNVVKTGGGNTLTVAAGTLVTGETLTVNGDNAGSLLSLRTQPENGINFADLQFNTYTASFLDVQGIHANNRFGNEINPVDSVDGGNTVGWFSYAVPGGITSNLEFWLSADAGIIESGGDVSNWYSQGPVANSADAVTGEEPTILQNSINFNPSVDFGSNDKRLTVDNGVPAHDTTVFGVGKRSNTTGTLANFWTTDAGNNEKAITAIDVTTNAIGYSSGFSFSGVGQSWEDQEIMSFSATTPAGYSPVFIGLNGDNYVGTSNDSLQGKTYSVLGNSSLNADDAQFGEIAETVIYNSSSVPAADREKIESYFAIKYGLSLEPAIGDYVDSDGTTIYPNGSYDVNVVGIGLDEAQGLDQRVSTSSNNLPDGTTGPVLTVALDPDYTSANNDTGRTTEFDDDKDFLVIGHDGAPVSTTANDLDTANYSLRTTREWYVSNNGSVGEVNLQFAGFNAGYSLVTDVDGDFTTTGDQTDLGALSATGEIAATLPDNVHFTLAVSPVIIEFETATASDDEASGGNLPNLLVDGTLATDTVVDVIISSASTAEIDANDFTFSTGAGKYPATVGVTIPAGTYNEATLALASLSSPSINILIPPTPVNFTIIDDAATEGDETIDLTLSGPGSGLVIGDVTGGNTISNHVYTITNDDFLLVEFAADSAGDENAGDNLPQLLVSGTTTSLTQVTITDDGTGTAVEGAGNDYTFTSPVVVNIVPGTYTGAPVSIGGLGLAILSDTTPEASKTIDFSISSPTNGAILGDADTSGSTDTDITYTITNDDNITVVIEKAASQVTPTNVDSAEYTVTFSEAIDPLTFDASDVDLSGTTGTVTSGPTTSDNTIFTFTVTGMSDGDVVSPGLPLAAASTTYGADSDIATVTGASVRFDSSPPTTTITLDSVADDSNLADLVTNDDDGLTLTATLSAPLGGGETLEYSDDDGATWTDITGSVSGTAIVHADPALISTTTVGFRVVDLAGNTGTESSDEVTIDTDAPAAPTTPDLNAASDTGDDDADDLTSVTTPLIDVACSEADSTLTLYTDAPVADTLAGTHTCTAVGPAQITVSPALAEGPQNLSYTETDLAGNVSDPSADLEVTVDAGGADVTIEKDPSQTSPTNTSPAMYIVTFDEPIDTVSFVPADVDTSASTATGIIVDAVTEIAPNDGTTFAVDVSATGDGDIVVTIPAGVVDDLSGNPNNLATTTGNTVAYDGTAPAAPAAPDLNAASDTGDDDADDLTSVTTPLIDVACSEADSTLTLYTDAPVADTLAGTHTCTAVGPAQITVSPALAEGPQNLSYTETDLAGNVSDHLQT